MSQELFYTSAPAGLKPGSSGFCTVAMTAGMSGILVQRLEMLSGYRELFPAGDEQSDENPVAWSHWRISNGERTSSLLSRVCFAGMDYTQRANTFAHHIVIDTSEQCPGGPAWVMSQPGLMESRWDGSPRLFPRGRQIPMGEDTPRVCSAWEASSGDAGWAGVLAETVSSDNSNIAYIIYLPGTDVLSLIREAMALLPPRQRWLTTFCTYFTELPAGLTCSWRCCVAGTLAAKEAHKYATSGIVIDLSKQMAATVESPLVLAARTGDSSSTARASVPAAAPTQDWRDGDSERAPNTSERSLKSLQSLHDLASNDRSRMPPRYPFLSERDGGEGPEQAHKSSQPRTVFWLVALLWPFLPITAALVCYLMWEPQALRDREMSIANLNAKIQLDEDALSETKKADQIDLEKANEQYNKLNSKYSGTTQRASAESNDARRQSQEENRRRGAAIAGKDAEIERVKTQDQADYAKALDTANQDAKQKLNVLQDQLASLKQVNSDLIAQLGTATTKPTFFWSGGLIGVQPKIHLNAPKNGDYSYKPVGEEIDISAKKGPVIASIVFQDGQLKLVNEDANAVATEQFHNWLQMASISVLDESKGNWIDFQLCSLPIFINDLGKSRILPEFAGSVDQSHIILAKAPQCDEKWRVTPSGDGLNCTFGEYSILLEYKDGKISRRDDPPKGFAGTLPTLVVDLRYQYDTAPATQVILCRIKITSPLTEQ